MYRRPGRLVWYCSFSDAEKHISLETEDEDRAREKFAQKLAERGGYLELEADEKSIVDLVDTTRQRADTNNTPKTAYEVHLNLRRIAKWLTERGVTGSRRIDRQLVEDYKTARRFDQVSAARINRELDSWRRMMKVAVELNAAHPRVLAGHDAGGIFEKLREPRPQPHQRGLSKADLTKFLRAVKDPGYRALFRTVLGCGIRDEEQRQLEAVWLQPPWIVVSPKAGWTTKGYRYRSIPVRAETLKAARDYIAARDKGLNIDQKRVWKVMGEACDKAGLDRRFSMHDLRRAWASHMLAAGNRIEDISRWLGHRDVLTTMRYLRVVEVAHPSREKLPW
jgi:integrase